MAGQDTGNADEVRKEPLHKGDQGAKTTRPGRSHTCKSQLGKSGMRRAQVAGDREGAGNKGGAGFPGAAQRELVLVCAGCCRPMPQTDAEAGGTTVRVVVVAVVCLHRGNRIGFF